VVKVSRWREREICHQIKAENRRNIRDLARFSNAELVEKVRSQRGLSFATGCKGVVMLFGGHRSATTALHLCYVPAR
jgi:hypothetical protein